MSEKCDQPIPNTGEAEGDVEVDEKNSLLYKTASASPRPRAARSRGVSVIGIRLTGMERRKYKSIQSMIQFGVVPFEVFLQKERKYILGSSRVPPQSSSGPRATESWWTENIPFL